LTVSAPSARLARAAGGQQWTIIVLSIAPTSTCPTPPNPTSGPIPSVLYVDIDIHHGDGVEEAFYLTDRVMTVRRLLVEE
jgi:hypothetical protein